MARPLEYIVASAAYQYCFEEEDSFAFPKTVDGFIDQFNFRYSCKMTPDLGRSVLKNLRDLGFIRIVEDKYAGLIISADQTQFDNAFSLSCSKRPDIFLSPISDGAIFYNNALSNSQLWSDLQSSDWSSDLVSLESEFEAVPASDRFVTLTHNSPEYKEIDGAIDNALIDLQENNFIAEAAGSDRDRLIAEGKAARSLISGEIISWEKLRSVVLSFLREVSKKFKEESIKWGVAKALTVVTKLLGIG